MIKTAELRKAFRYWLDGKSHPAWSKNKYKRQIKASLEILKKYLSQFKIYFNEYYSNQKKLCYHEKLCGIKLLQLKKREPYFYEIAAMVKNIPILKKEFLEYFFSKTHLSFEINKIPKPIKQSKFATTQSFLKYLDERNPKEGTNTKLAEFCFILLSEYIVLHNLIWVSKIKTKEIKTIDTWIKNFDGQ